MDNLGKQILRSQNEEFHIDELLAQKEIYSEAKIYQMILVVITVFLPIAISIIIKYNESLIDQSSWIFALYLILATTAEKILESTISRLKKIAASIKEMFDTKVLQIPSNETLNLVIIDKETVYKYSKEPRKHRSEVEYVTNWYSLNISDIKTNIATILCQRTNVHYDFSVRKRYNMLMILLVAFTFLILLIISLINSINLKAFLIEVILPTIPVFMFAYKEVNTNLESIDNLHFLRRLIETNLSSINIDDEVETSLLRNIQDRIYLNRILSPLIPDSIYKSIRPRLEDEMNYSVKEKIRELRNT